MGHRDSITPVGRRRVLGKASRLFLLFERLGFGATGICDRGNLAGARFIMALALCGCYFFGEND